MKTKIDKLLEKLNKHSVDNDKEFLECLIDLDYRVKQLEKHNTPTCVGENKLNGRKNQLEKENNKLIKRLKKIKEIKTETKPINIKFKTKDGKNVSFKAVKVVEKKIKNDRSRKH
jgi:hypothetical protein